MGGKPKNGPETPSLASDQRGQVTAEYALLVMWTMLPLLAGLMLVWQGLLDYYQDIASLICLPIP